MIKQVCTFFLKMSGWTFKVDLPEDLRSFVFIGAPHTSNYDFIPTMALIHRIQRNAKFVIKDDWMKFPLNLFLTPAGAIGLDRKKIKELGKASNTDLMAALFHLYPELVLMISPEGTRSPNPTWKTGFYYIAQKAGVPLVLGYADYKKKEAGVADIIYPRNFESDMNQIMKFYQTVQAKKPDSFKLDRRFL
jgi:1-acyl-sn-glycerol-3-phosphate acyltransferase